MAEDLTQPDHDRIMTKVTALMGTDPMELLPRHRQLLDWDFGNLGEGPTVDRQYWIARMESGIKACGIKRGQDAMRDVSYNSHLTPKCIRLA